MAPETPICQSCGMPLRSESDLGTNANGSKNKEYCRFCFKDGQFTDPDITMEQKIDKLVSLAAKMNIPEKSARQMASNLLPTLKRWKTK
jgi:hypothetical protein